MSEWHAELIQGGMVMAEVTASTEEDAMREIMHYAMMYMQDGPVIVKRPERRSLPHPFMEEG